MSSNSRRPAVLRLAAGLRLVFLLVAAMLILEEFDVEWVRLSVNKPGAIRHSKDVGVAVLRTRADLAAGTGK